MRCVRRSRFMWIAIAALAALAGPAVPAAPLPNEAALPPATLLASDDRTFAHMVGWLENRVRKDPEDFVAYNKLAGAYLQRLRETGDATFLTRGSQAARASLATLPAERNRDALNLLAQAEFAAHEFDAAREHAQRLVRLEPDRAHPYQILGDALLELGDYAAAEAAYGQMQQRGGVQEITQVATHQRLGKMAILRGDLAAAQRSFTQALLLALARPDPPRETVAWCRWQLGETAFMRGDYGAAEQHYRDALTTFPRYFRAVASLGRVRAARGDLADAIVQYEAAVKILPDPSFVAALGDLYLLSGREREAARQYDLVEAIARLSAAGGALYNRQQALFYADHGREPEKAYAMAAREYEVRRDIYGADAVAWTALKAGRVDEARAMIKVALQLGTQDARLLYHAAMIANAASDPMAARDFLQRALALSPGFDPLQSSLAKNLAAASTSPAAFAAPKATPNGIAAVRP